MARLKDYANGQRMVTGDLENFVIEKVYTPRFKYLEGLTLRDAGGKMDRHVIDTMLEIAIADELRMTVSAVRVARCRARARSKDALREIAPTLDEVIHRKLRKLLG